MRFTDLVSFTAGLEQELEEFYLSGAVVTKTIVVGGGVLGEGNLVRIGFLGRL